MFRGPFGYSVLKCSDLFTSISAANMSQSIRTSKSQMNGGLILSTKSSTLQYVIGHSNHQTLCIIGKCDT